VRLRYVGTTRVTFTHTGVGDVSPGDEFTVTDEEAPGFLARADVLEVETSEPVADHTPSLNTFLTPDPTPEPDPVPETEDTPDTTGESADVAADS